MPRRLKVSLVTWLIVGLAVILAIVAVAWVIEDKIGAFVGELFQKGLDQCDKY